MYIVRKFLVCTLCIFSKTMGGNSRMHIKTICFPYFLERIEKSTKQRSKKEQPPHAFYKEEEMVFVLSQPAFCSSRSRSAINAINSEFVGFPLWLLTV